MARPDRGTELPSLDINPPAPDMVPASMADFQSIVERAEIDRIEAAKAGYRERFPEFNQEQQQQHPSQSPVDQLGQVMQGNEADIGAMQAAALQRVPYSYSNPAYAPTRRYLDETQGEIVRDASGRTARDQYGNAVRSGGALQAERDATAESVEAKRLQQTRLANEYDMQIREAGTELAVAKATERMYAAEKQEQLQAQRTIQESMQAALQRIQTAPEIDPQRYWNSKSAGFKFGAALAAGLRGLSGDRNAMSHITDAIRDDIDAQKANFQQKVTAAGVVGQQSAMANNLFAQIMDSVKDERAATLTLENVRLEQAKQRLEQMSMEMGIPIESSQGQAMLAQLDQKLAQNNMQLEMMANTTPRQITGSRYALDDRGLDIVKGALSSGYKRQEDITGQMAKMVGEQGDKEQAKQDKYLYGEHGLIKRRESFAKQVEPVVAMKDALATLRNHLESGGGANFDLKTRRLRRLGVQAIGRALSGAAISEEEWEQFDDLINAYTASGNIEKIKMAERLADSKIQNAAQGVGSDAAAAYFGVSEDKLPSMGITPTFESIGGSSRGGSSVVDVDQ